MAVTREATRSGVYASLFYQGTELLKLTVAALLLNAMLSMTSIWPTLGVRPDSRIAPEFIGLILVLTVMAHFKPKIGRTALKALTFAYLVLLAGRYMDIVAPSLFGRPINFYWDLPQLPRLMWVTLQDQPLWRSVLVMACVAGGLYAIYTLTLACIKTLNGPISRFARHLWLRASVFLLCLLAVANYAGVQATWPYVSKPVVPVYWGQVRFLWNAWFPDRLEEILPPSTVINNALEQNESTLLGELKGRDFNVIFLESYGACLYDNQDMEQSVSASRERLEQAIQESGRKVVSAFYTSPTIGGASDLAHLSVISGIDLTDSRRHDLLLTTHRPNLFDVFRKAGYEAWGVYHSVWWDWVERRHYRYDHYVDGPSLDYPGPEIGYWKIPDQYAWVRYQQKYAKKPGDKPRLSFFFTISTHFPFNPTPPYQQNWERLLSPEPYDPADLSAAWHSEVNWLNMTPGYLSTIEYTHQWLSDYFLKTGHKEDLYLLIGDHQPTANVSGEGTTWDVPVFLISKDAEVLNRFEKLGFTPGLTPKQRESQGKLSELTTEIIDSFSKTPTAPVKH